MSNCPLCNLRSAPAPPPSNPASGNRPPRLLRRAWESAQWLCPAALLVLMPKCPLCVAGYVALFTGIGITVSAARWIQILLPAFCLSSLAYLAVRYWRKRA
jgi:hypothetical protein